MINHHVSNIQLPFPLLFFFAVPATVIILLTIFGNLLVLCFKARVGRTNTTLLVWNLGLTDFLVGVFVLPMGAVHLITRKWLFGRLLCRIWVAADVTFCTCSVVSPNKWRDKEILISGNYLCDLGGPLSSSYQAVKVQIPGNEVESDRCHDCHMVVFVGNPTNDSQMGTFVELSGRGKLMS